MRRFPAPAVGAGVMLGLAACSADVQDFQEQGAQFIEGDEVRERMGGVRMSGAECEEPADTDEDTLFGCTATGSDGNKWVFQIEITGSKSLRVVAGEVAGSAAPDSTDASTPASVAPDTASTGAATAPVSPVPPGPGPGESVADSVPAATTSTTPAAPTTTAPPTSALPTTTG